MLRKSRLLSFIDSHNEYTLHFVEGQKLIHDLALIHDLKGQGFAYFRDSVLSIIPLVTLLKHGDTLGFYIDSKDPYFLLKIEMNEAGHFRSLLLPETFNQFPDKITGQARLSKIRQGQREPYTSIIKLEDESFHQVVNIILKDSYQIKGEVFVSEVADQAIFINQLPRKNWDKEEAETPLNFDEFKKERFAALQDIFAQAYNDDQPVIDRFESEGYQYLLGKDLDFKCNCSYERMIMGVSSLLHAHSLDDIFKGDKSIETRCDYCKTYYQIPRSEFEKLKN